jgi:hypothetical protein
LLTLELSFQKSNIPLESTILSIAAGLYQQSLHSGAHGLSGKEESYRYNPGIVILLQRRVQKKHYQKNLGG